DTASIAGGIDGTGGVDLRETLRALAERHGSGIRALEDLLAQTPASADDVLAQLAAQCRMQAVTMQTLNGMQPDFEVVPFVEATTRLAICFRDPEDARGGLLFVIADPLDRRTRGSLEQRMRARPTVPYRWALASVGDITAWLAVREKDVRAMDSLA